MVYLDGGVRLSRSARTAGITVAAASGGAGYRPDVVALERSPAAI
jgi:hypothetical protein